MRMGRGDVLLLCGLAAMTCLVLAQPCAAYTSFTVGDDRGWRLVNAPNYTVWAAQHSYSLGDSLIFNFELNHSVAHTLNATIYNGCNFTNGDGYSILAQPGNATFVNYTLHDLGLNYFGCPSFESSHCRLGMKFAVNVSFGAGLPPPPPAAPPPPPPQDPPGVAAPPPPSPSGALGSASAGNLVGLLLLLLWGLVATS